MSAHDLSTGLGRLKQLRDDLVRLDKMKARAPITFDMRNWASKHECGTSACALGWCAMQPWAQKLGLRITPAINPFDLTQDPNYNIITFGDRDGFKAAEAFFEFPHEEALEYELFDPTAYGDDLDGNPTLTEVIARMGKIIATLEARAA